MSVWVTLLSFSVSMIGGFVRVLGCVGVVCRWGVWVCGWVFMNPTGRGVCVVKTHNPTHPWGGTIMCREASVVKTHTQQTHTPTRL